MSEHSEAGQTDVTDQFTGLMKFALDHGSELIRNRGALVPFTISVAQGEFKVAAFTLPPVEAVEAAKTAVRQLPAETEAYAIVFLGDINLSGKPYKAVVVEGSERGQPHGFRLGQPLEPRGTPPQLQVVGEAVNLGLCEQLMR